MQSSLLRLIGCLSNDKHRAVLTFVSHLSAVWWLDGLAIFYVNSCGMLTSLLDHIYTCSLSVCLPLSFRSAHWAVQHEGHIQVSMVHLLVLNKQQFLRFYHAKWYNVSEASGRYPDDFTISQLHDCCETLLRYSLSPSCCLSTPIMMLSWGSKFGCLLQACIESCWGQ